MPATMSNANYFATEQENPAPETTADIAQDQQRLREIAVRVEQLRSETLERIASRGRDHAGILQVIKSTSRLMNSSRILRSYWIDLTGCCR